MRFRLDTRLSEASTIGARAGMALDEGSLLAQRLMGRLQELHQATEAGLLPALRLAADPQAARRAVELGASWRGSGRSAADRLVLVGEPGAVAAAALLARSLGRSDLSLVDQPDSRLIHAALDGARRPRVLALSGPRWVPAAVAAMGLDAARVTVAMDEDDTTLSWGQPWVAPGAMDGRLGAVGPAGLAVLGWAGCPEPLLSGLIEALGEAVDVVHGGASRANPSLRLALLARGLEAADPASAPALVASTPALRRWASWAASTWLAVRSRSAPRGAAFELMGATPLVCAAGDEAAVQRLCEGSRGPWSLLLGIDGLPADALAAEALALLNAQASLLSDHGRPAVRILLRDDSPATLAQLCVWWAVGCLLAASLDAVDPLTMDAADRLRQDLSHHS